MWGLLLCAQLHSSAAGNTLEQQPHRSCNAEPSQPCCAACIVGCTLKVVAEAGLDNQHGLRVQSYDSNDVVMAADFRNLAPLEIQEGSGAWEERVPLGPPDLRHGTLGNGLQ